MNQTLSSKLYLYGDCCQISKILHTVEAITKRKLSEILFQQT